MLANRTKLAIPDYETKFKQQLPKDGSIFEVDPASDPAAIVLTGIQEHKRQYIKNNQKPTRLNQLVGFTLSSLYFLGDKNESRCNQA